MTAPTHEPVTVTLADLRAKVTFLEDQLAVRTSQRDAAVERAELGSRLSWSSAAWLGVAAVFFGYALLSACLGYWFEASGGVVGVAVAVMTMSVDRDLDRAKAVLGAVDLELDGLKRGREMDLRRYVDGNARSGDRIECLTAEVDTLRTFIHEGRSAVESLTDEHGTRSELDEAEDAALAWWRRTADVPAAGQEVAS